MEMRVFGRTGMQLSVLGFGCGAVGGLMVRGDPRDQERTIARAIASGVYYFDTAVQYGNGESEENLGRVLQKLKPANVVVGTKVRLPSGDLRSRCSYLANSTTSHDKPMDSRLGPDARTKMVPLLGRGDRVLLRRRIALNPIRVSAPSHHPEKPRYRQARLSTVFS